MLSPTKQSPNRRRLLRAKNKNALATTSIIYNLTTFSLSFPILPVAFREIKNETCADS